MANWNPWHGCHKLSSGCANCYVYRGDAKYDRDSSNVHKTQNFNLPVKRNKYGEYKLSDDIVYTCFTSDFFLEDADEWRKEAWEMIRIRKDLKFFIITKRIDRFFVSLPDDWNDGYDHVAICCTVENQDRADYRLPIYLELPIKHKMIMCEPLLENIELSNYLSPKIEKLVAGGESGDSARICNYDWVLSLRDQCALIGVPFVFKQTGARFIKDGKGYNIPRKYQHLQAIKAGITTDLTWKY